MSDPVLVPFLRYQDAAAAIDWLPKAFGFETRLVVPGPEGSIVHAQLRLGDAVIMLASVRDDGLRSPRDLPATSQGVFVVVTDLDSHYEQARAAGAEIVQEIETLDEGGRVYTTRDLEGHVWAFGDRFDSA